MADHSGFRRGPLELVDDVSPADWIVDQAHPFLSHDLGTLLPTSFPAFARIFHPARRGSDTYDTPVRWSEIAAANGRIAHPGMGWAAITGDWRYWGRKSQPGLWDYEPEEGTLPLPLAKALAEVLANFTATASQCWFAVWEGSSTAWPRDTAAKVKMPERHMGLFRGPIDGITTNFNEQPEPGGAWSGEGWPFYQSAHLWWPDDRSWCVATETDLMSTYLAGSRSCIEEILTDDRFEALPVPADHIVAFDADRLNPPPLGTPFGR